MPRLPLLALLVFSLLHAGCDSGGSGSLGGATGPRGGNGIFGEAWAGR